MKDSVGHVSDLSDTIKNVPLDGTDSDKSETCPTESLNRADVRRIYRLPTR